PVNHRLRTKRHAEFAADSARSIYKFLPAQLPKKKLHTQRTQPAHDGWQGHRRDPIDPKHVHRSGVVAQHDWTAIPRSPPETLPAKADLPIRKRQAHVRV